MSTWLGAAVGLPQPSASAAATGEYAILPQQSEDALVLSEVHSHLDRVISFLQREVGYLLLDDAAPRLGGGVHLRNAPGLRAAEAAGAQGLRSARLPRRELQEVRDEETKQVITLNRETAKYARFPDDLVLVWQFVNRIIEACPDAERKIKHEELYRKVLKGIRLMHSCDFNYSDVVVTLAYASVYFAGTYAAIGGSMSVSEAAHVVVLLIFLAHSFVLDETCPLRYWQRNIFRNYCTLKVLDAALFRLFEMRLFVLRVPQDEEKRALSALLRAGNGFDVVLSESTGSPRRLTRRLREAGGDAHWGPASNGVDGHAAHASGAHPAGGAAPMANGCGAGSRANGG